MTETIRPSWYDQGGIFQDPGGEWKPLGAPPVPALDNIEAARRYIARYAGLEAPSPARQGTEQAMTETARTARTNADGHPCPPWCEVDHGDRPGSKIRLSYHGTEAPVIHTPSGYVQATAYQNGFNDDAPVIALSCLAPHGAALVDARHSETLAAVIEQLADATPDQHRELAAAIRQAAAQVTEARDG